MPWVDTLLYDIWWLLQTHSSFVTLRATQVVWTQMMATWDMWYIDEGFLVWIIPLMYQSRESILWAYTIVLSILVFIACLFLLKLSILFSMHAFRFRLIDIHVFTWFRIYGRSFNFLYVTCHCLYVWTTLLDHVHVWRLSTPTGFIICTRGIASDNPGSSCPDSRCLDHGDLIVADQSAQRILPWRSEGSKVGRHRSSSSQSFS